jgi:hypothetical protein
MAQDEFDKMCPWMFGKLTQEGLNKFREWVIGRKAAATTIDVETCEWGYMQSWDFDPYGIGHAEYPDFCLHHLDDLQGAGDAIGWHLHVWAPDSDGVICDLWLSEDQREALYARIDRERPAEAVAERDRTRARIEAAAGMTEAPLPF